MVSHADLEKFERRYGIRLPEDYRDFVTQIGNGGAGPHYGVESLECAARYSNPAMPYPWCSEILLSGEDSILWGKQPGVLEIAQRGCGYTDFLVVNGVNCGQIWSDFSSVDGPLSPTHASFANWYLQWARGCIATIKREPLIDQICVGMSVDEVRSILGTDMQQWEANAQLPDSPNYYIGFTNTNASFSIGPDQRVMRITKIESFDGFP